MSAPSDAHVPANNTLICAHHHAPGMQASGSYQGCCVCTHSSSRAVIGTKCIPDGYRRFLKPGSRGRQRRVLYRGIIYEYKDVSTRPPPKSRDHDFVLTALQHAKRINLPSAGKIFMFKINCPTSPHSPCRTQVPTVVVEFSWLRLHTFQWSRLVPRLSRTLARTN